MSQDNKISLELVQLRSDVLYLVRLVERLEAKIAHLDDTVKQLDKKPSDPLAGKIIERL
jgi:hypothetical protein